MLLQNKSGYNYCENLSDHSHFNIRNLLEFVRNEIFPVDNSQLSK